MNLAERISEAQIVATFLRAEGDRSEPGRAPPSSFLTDEGEERVRAAYPGETWDRLVAVKRRYDPTNVFRLNQNIPPG